MTTLHRIDPVRNMRRFWRVSMTPTLFQEVAVIREWGRIGRNGTVKIATYPDRQSAEKAEQRSLRQKLKRGYVAVSVSR